MNGAKHVIDASKSFFIKNLGFLIGNICKMLAVVVHHIAAMVYSRIVDGESAFVVGVKTFVNEIFISGSGRREEQGGAVVAADPVDFLRHRLVE